MNVSRETRERLKIFEREFERWSRTHNLVSGSERGNIVERHIKDSLQLATCVQFHGDWVDIGTGGGFPGVVLATLAEEHEDVRVSMIESNAKKCAFLRHVCATMELKAVVLHERAERVIARMRPPSVVTARAVASLPKLVSLCEPWLAGGTIGLFPKGRSAAKEVAEASADWTFEWRAHPSETAADASVIELHSLRPKSAAKIKP